MLNLLDTSVFNLFYLILILILAGLNIVFFISQKKENSAIKLKILIIILLLISIIIFISASLPLLCFSTILFLYSLNNTKEDVIRLRKPSFFKSRKGRIKIGRAMEKTHKKHKFILSLKDLEKHMFICGATGTGKSNFVQNFLINFSKRYNIPFLLVEFKGEYQFLQKKIDNLLIIRPGENFSINIFNPEGSLPGKGFSRDFD
jgi:predicted NACHT family NTPase